MGLMRAGRSGGLPDKGCTGVATLMCADQGRAGSQDNRERASGSAQSHPEGTATSPSAFRGRKRPSSQLGVRREPQWVLQVQGLLWTLTASVLCVFAAQGHPWRTVSSRGTVWKDLCNLLVKAFRIIYKQNADVRCLYTDFISHSCAEVTKSSGISVGSLGGDTHIMSSAHKGGCCFCSLPAFLPGPPVHGEAVDMCPVCS